VIRVCADVEDAGDVVLEDPTAAPTKLWRQLASDPAVKDALEHSVRLLVDGEDRASAVDVLEEAIDDDMESVAGLFATAAVDAVAGERGPEVLEAADECRRSTLRRLVQEEVADQIDADPLVAKAARPDMTGEDVDEAGQICPDEVLVESAVEAVADAAPIDGTWSAIHAAARSLGGQTTLGPSGGKDAILRGPVALLESSGIQPTVDVQLGTEFMTLAPAQRGRLLRFLTDLSEGFVVRLACGPVIARVLSEQHADDLPASAVNEAANQTPTACPAALEERVEAALDAVAMDDSAWRTLSTIAEEPREERTHNALYNDSLLDVGDSAIRKQLARLEDAGLVERRRDGNTHIARVTRVGVLALQRLEAEVGLPGGPKDARDSDARETAAGGSCGSGGGPEGCGGNSGRTGGPSADSGAVNDPPNSSAGAVFSPCEGGRGEEGPAGGRPAAEAAAAARDGSSASRPPEVRWMARRRHDAIVGSATGLDVALVDAPTVDREHPGDRFVSFDEDREEIVVDVEAHPTRVAVTGVRLASALASNQLMYAAVDLPSRIDEGGPLEGMSIDNEVVLRKGRCLGWLSDRDLDGRSFVDRLKTAREQLLSKAGNMTDSSGDWKPDVAAEVLRESLGLIGTLTHVYDLVDVDVHRQLSLPEFNRNWNLEKEARRSSLRRFLAMCSTIGSHHGAYGMYRKLYERRQPKREDALSGPAVDPADPTGEHIGSWSLVGPGVDGFKPDLEKLLESEGWEVHADAVDAEREFLVDLEVGQGWRREAVVSVAGRILDRKRLRLTPEATSLLLGMLGSPLALATALDRLGEETTTRRIFLDEVRLALAMLPSEALLPASTRGVRRMVSALLGADGPLSTSALAERADVDEQTVSTHRDRLEALGLIDVQEDGAGRETTHRIRVPSRDERFDDEAPVPEFLVEGPERTDMAAFVDVDDPGQMWPAEVREDISALPLVLEEVLNRLGESIAAERPDLWGRIWPADGADREDVDVLWTEGRWSWLRRYADLLVALRGQEVGGRLEWSDGPWTSSTRLGAEPSAPAHRQSTLQEALGLAAAD
jgi:DNA-binding transcriptional ArsR family regulator